MVEIKFSLRFPTLFNFFSGFDKILLKFLRKGKSSVQQTWQYIREIFIYGTCIGLNIIITYGFQCTPPPYRKTDDWFGSMHISWISLSMMKVLIHGWIFINRTYFKYSGVSMILLFRN